MCGRYLIRGNLAPRVQTYLDSHPELMEASKQGTSGEVFPGMCAPILLLRGGQLKIGPSVWGLRFSSQKRTVINARAETLIEKNCFRDLFYNSGRCLVPATAFYEWTSAEESTRRKQKYLCAPQDSNTIYFAGLYDEDTKRFLIVTTAACDTLQKIHARMPLVLVQEEGLEWLRDDKKAELFLSRTDSMHWDANLADEPEHKLSDL